MAIAIFTPPLDRSHCPARSMRSRRHVPFIPQFGIRATRAGREMGVCLLPASSPRITAVASAYRPSGTRGREMEVGVPQPPPVVCLRAAWSVRLDSAGRARRFSVRFYASGEGGAQVGRVLGLQQSSFAESRRGFRGDGALLLGHLG